MRTAAGLSVDDLAARLGWARASLYEYERADRVEPTYVRAIADALGVDPPDSPLRLELIESGTCDDGCIDGHDDQRYYPPRHGWWDFAVLVNGHRLDGRYRVHAYLDFPGDANWYDLPYGGAIDKWVRADLHNRHPLLSEAAVRAADPWPGSAFDPVAYRESPPWTFWK